MIDFSIAVVCVLVVSAIVGVSLLVALSYDSNTRSMPHNDDEIKNDDSEKRD